MECHSSAEPSSLLSPCLTSLLTRQLPCLMLRPHPSCCTALEEPQIHWNPPGNPTTTPGTPPSQEPHQLGHACWWMGRSCAALAAAGAHDLGNNAQAVGAGHGAGPLMKVCHTRVEGAIVQSSCSKSYGSSFGSNGHAQVSLLEAFCRAVQDNTGLQPPSLAACAHIASPGLVMLRAHRPPTGHTMKG